ncbi:MAG: DUF4097 family beta strand repeat protein [Acidobacteriaceae bacterium]|nr:DUF4097 family beta strand repeat protein [Acidobacteriaceae bacterium]
MACFADEWNKRFDVSGTPELHISAGNAALEVRAGSGSGVDVELKTEGYSIGPSQVHIEPHQEGNRLDLRVEMPEQHFNWGNHWVRVEVRVPQNVNAFIKNDNGPVNLRDLHGAAHLNTGNGPIDIKAFDGSIDAQTGNGPVSLNGRLDALQLRTGNGPIDLTVNSGSKLTSNWHVETGNGPVDIKLPQDIRADVSVHKGNGPLSFHLPAETRAIDDHDIHAKLNGGGPELTIHTGHGPVSIGRS